MQMAEDVSGKLHGSVVMSTVILLHGQRQTVYILSMPVGVAEDSTSSLLAIIFSHNFLLIF